MNKQSSDYRVELDAYSGPLDLLLYLIRREEVDVYDIPIARVTEQYLHYLNLFAELNINVAGEFVVMAATLMEIKSRMMAPQPEEMPEEEMEDPRLELVRQLMEYKRFKEAALALTDRAAQRAERFTRAGERVGDEDESRTAPPTGLTLWTLLDAFSRILEQTGRRGPHTVIFDEIPQERIQADLEREVRAAGRMSFLQAFDGRPNRSILIGVFLALLELVRRQVIHIEQEQPFGEIWLTYVPEEERTTFAEPEPPPETIEPGPEMSETDLTAQWSPADLEMDLSEAPPVEEAGESSPSVSEEPPAATDLREA